MKQIDASSFTAVLFYKVIIDRRIYNPRPFWSEVMKNFKMFLVKVMEVIEISNFKIVQALLMSPRPCFWSD